MTSTILSTQLLLPFVFPLLGLCSPFVVPTQPRILFPSIINTSSAGPLLSVPWDSRFSIRAGYSSVRLPPTSTLMNAVDVAANLATLDFDKQFEVHFLPLPKYTDVQIEFEAVPPAKYVDAKILVWGLYGGINDIVGRKQFREVEFDLLWSGKVVAWLRFEKVERKTLSEGIAATENGTSSILEPEMSQNKGMNGFSATSDLSGISKNLAAGPNPAFGFAAQFTPYAKPLSIFQVFMSVLAALVQVAVFRVTTIVKPLVYEALDYNSQIAVLRRERKAPPFFEYRWLIEGLKRIPEFMLAQGRFAELGWKVMVGGKELGSGFCEWTDWKRPQGLSSD